MTKKKEIKFDGKKYILKSHSYRAMFMFEELAGKDLSEASTLEDNIMFIYCMLMSSNEFPYSYDAFLDALDDNDHIIEEYAKLVGSVKK